MLLKFIHETNSRCVLIFCMQGRWIAFHVNFTTRSTQKEYFDTPISKRAIVAMPVI